MNHFMIAFFCLISAVCVIAAPSVQVDVSEANLVDSEPRTVGGLLGGLVGTLVLALAPLLIPLSAVLDPITAALIGPGQLLTVVTQLVATLTGLSIAQVTAQFPATGGLLGGLLGGGTGTGTGVSASASLDLGSIINSILALLGR